MARDESCEHGKYCFVFPCLIADFIEKLLNKSVQLGEFVHYKGYKPEDSVDLRWLKLDYAIERVKKIISVYEHKASHSNYYCYADMADALRRLYEKERTACVSYI